MSAPETYTAQQIDQLVKSIQALAQCLMAQTQAVQRLAEVLQESLDEDITGEDPPMVYLNGKRAD